MNVDVEGLMDETKESAHVVSKSIDMFSIEDIKKIVKLSRKNDILVTMSYESNSMYERTMINLVKKSVIDNSQDLLKII